jgi:plasmid stabilization system protein ParE
VPRRLSYTEKAGDDLDAVRRWLTQPGAGPAARRRLAAIRADIRRLKQHPCRYPVGQHRYPVGQHPGVRELPCAGGYRALYRVIPDTGHDDTAGDVRVLRVFGPGQSRDRQ